MKGHYKSDYSWQILCYKAISVLFINIFINCFKLYSVNIYIILKINYLIYCQFEKLRRNVFMAASQYDTNGHINYEIFSILLPKFVQDRVISG